MACGLAWSGASPLLALLHAPGALGVGLLLRQAAADLSSGNSIHWGGKAYDLMGTNTHDGTFVSREPPQSRGSTAEKQLPITTNSTAQTSAVTQNSASSG